MASFNNDPVTLAVPTAPVRPAAGKPAHVIVVGNEKGGSGKSTLAVHIIVALLQQGHRVASIDTDSRQLSLTRYLENRSRWARTSGVALDVPTHYSVRLGEGKVVAEVEAREFAAFAEIIERLGERYDFVVIDTPGNDSYRMRLSHAMADTLVTPVNDSLVDLDVLGRLEGEDLALTAVSQYADLVQIARRERLAATRRPIDWIVVRNRIASLASRNQRNVVAGLDRLSAALDFRIADGITERLIFREFFSLGLTVFDTLDRRLLGIEPTMSHVAARREIRELVACFNLPRSHRAAGSAPGGGTTAPPIAAAAG